VARRQGNDRRGPQKRGGGGHGGGGHNNQRRQGGGGDGGGHAGARSHPRQQRNFRPHGRKQGGPATCPMCGAVVPDLKQHIHQRHDDAESHPRQ
jgi:hypothetical protein